MIVEKQTEAHVLQEGTSNESVAMSLDLESAQHLMMMLSKNLYSDPIGSTIRECASNALDSHRRSGSDKPIIVSFKRNNQADTYEFAVEDFGIGLDADDVRNIISKYGKSTKRESNTELGMMGLGFKAPLAYSSSFYFVARKNGIERKYMMYEGEDTNTIDLLYETPTTEGNGVKVIVPVKYSDRYTFTQKIKEQLAYFESVYFDVDSSIGYDVRNDFTIHRSEHFQYSSMASTNDMHLCLDNVSYPIDWDKLGMKRINMKLALKFSLTDGLFPTPNRESIRYTQEAKKIITDKINTVANVFMEKFNESITDNADIQAIFAFHSNRHRTVPNFFTGNTEDVLNVTEILEIATLPMKTPKLEGVELLDLERLAQKGKDYFLGEYQTKYRFSNGRYENAKGYWSNNIRLQDLEPNYSGHRAAVYVYEDRLGKNMQDYLRDKLSDKAVTHFVKKDKPFKLRSGHQIDYSTYYSLLNLQNYPKSQWRQLINELQTIIGMFSKDFIDIETISIPDEWHAAKKAKRMKVAQVVIGTGTKKVRMKGEFSGKVASHTEMVYSDKFSKFVPTTFKMEDIHKEPKLCIYGKEADRTKLDKLWSVGGKHAKFIIVADKTFENLQKADLHNWITIEKFMEGKNRPFKTTVTNFLIEELITKYRATFQRISIIKDISTDLADKLTQLEKYGKDNYRRHVDGTTKLELIEFATENNLFDQPIYMVYKQISEVFNKLPFLNTMMDKLGYTLGVYDAPMQQAIIDLFKYHKQKVNLENYTIKLTEDASLEETLTDETVDQLQTI